VITREAQLDKLVRERQEAIGGLSHSSREIGAESEAGRPAKTAASRAAPVQVRQRSPTGARLSCWIATFLPAVLPGRGARASRFHIPASSSIN